MIAIQRRPILVPRKDRDIHNAVAGPSRLPTQPQIIAPTPIRAAAIRRRRSSSPFEPRLESPSDSPNTPPPARARSASKTGTPSRPPSRVERRFRCEHEGCDKAYFKPSRLAEHELTHSGERPHTCPHCDQTYLRASHLTAHMRTHLPATAREHHCSIEGCDKAFWTATHLKRHLAMHDQAVIYPCEHCSSTFHKANHLRDHIALAHLPPGTKSFQCSHDGCAASFEFRQKLKAHEKTHDASRYSCSHPSHEDRPCFPTWTALQTHLHTAHPPECPHPECGGRKFPNLHRLKDHLKVHAHRAEDIVQAGDDDGPVAEKIHGNGVEGSGPSRKRRRSSVAAPGGEDEQGGIWSKLARFESGEAGKDWACREEGCDKTFKTKLAMKTHRRVAHSTTGDNKIHKCPIATCDKAYAHAVNLREHMSTHANLPSPETQAAPAKPLADQMFGTEKRRYGCPFPHIRPTNALSASSRAGADTGDDVQPPPAPLANCYARFWRVYDVRRHLKADHGVDLEDGEARELLAMAADDDAADTV